MLSAADITVRPGNVGDALRVWILCQSAKFHHRQMSPSALLLPVAEFDALMRWAYPLSDKGEECLALERDAILMRVPSGPLRVTPHDGPRAWTFPEAW